MAIDFDEIIDRRNTQCAKWDKMEPLYGVSGDSGIPMWVADMDFRPPEAASQALAAILDHDVYGYFGSAEDLNAALVGWMKRRHDWDVDPSWILQSHGLVNALGLCLNAYSEKGDGVIIFSPVYHWFANIIKANERRMVESELVLRDGAYHMDFDALEAQMTGDEKILMFCSPHNPGGRVWTRDELRAVADFCIKHDLILISDEVHHDLIMPGHHHIAAPLAMQHALDRLVMLVATTKTFNLAGTMTGNIVISDDSLRARMARTHRAAGMSANRFGMIMSQAAYNHGDEWLDTVIAYIDENRRIFADGVAQIPGLNPMPMMATYLTWVNFADTGMTPQEFNQRVNDAGIAASVGSDFGTGGETFLRFNLATRRALIEDAVNRLQTAFADLQ